MVDVRFELTTDDPWSVDDAICEGISPLGYLRKVKEPHCDFTRRFESCRRRHIVRLSLIHI